MKVLALYSNKGGVGKTAATVNLAYLAAQAGLQTLVCDLDAQSSTTFYFRTKPKLKKEARGFTKKKRAIDNSIKGTDYDNLDLLPADFSHRNLDLVFSRLKNPTKQLHKVFHRLQDEYDLIILDCPPYINILAENIFNAADMLLVPLIPTVLSERTHKQLITFFSKKGYDTAKIHAFLSMVDRRKTLHRDLTELLRTKFDGVFETLIPYSSDVEKMGLHREPINKSTAQSTAASAYQQLWDELYLKLV
ncbi:MAG: AAA family ATPase [Anaerolineae bacterium]|nr:AAA family ATPase [Anaerolineae bacterium]